MNPRRISSGATAARLAAVLCAGLAVGLFCGCGRRQQAAPDAAAPAPHQHHPPHGGTPVVLGAEECHLELVLDAAAGTVQAYVMDGELENYVRVPQESFALTVIRPGGQAVLEFLAVANRATGETVGDTSQFAAGAEWLKTDKTFDGILRKLAVKDRIYENVAFNFPKGNDPGETHEK